MGNIEKLYYRITLWNNITDLYHTGFYGGMILRDNITELYCGIILPDNIMELYDGIISWEILRNYITE